MSADLITSQAMTAEQAERVTEQIAFRIDSITENYEVVMSLMRDALARNAHEALGYVSPGAYITERFGQSLQTLGTALRREFVHELSDAGLSTRAIAPVFAVGKSTIARDLESGVPGGTGDTGVPAERMIRATYGDEYVDAVKAEGITIDARTGEVLDDAPEPTVTEHTFTEKVKTVTGLDGKQYKREEPREPRRRSLVDDAHTASKELFLAIERIRGIEADDRYQRNKVDILAALQPSIDLATETLNRLTTI